VYDKNLGLRGYADGRPSEVIQRHSLGTMSVGVVFPYKPHVEFLEVPVAQYKKKKVSTKAAAAGRLIRWLEVERECGLQLSGSVNVHTMSAAVELGVSLIEELPNSRVEEQSGGYKLICEDMSYNLAEAVALQYYYFCSVFGTLRARSRLPEGFERLTLFMDRFSGASPQGVKVGQQLPLTKGAQFMRYCFRKSPTWLGIQEEESKNGAKVHYANLDWWKDDKGKVRPGKTHPHFIITDWLTASAAAKLNRPGFPGG